MILDRAFELACAEGLESLSVGQVATAAAMSKSGVFVHFGSREDMQLAVLSDAGRRFVEHVIAPAISAERGLPRLRRLVERWFDWGLHRKDGGCIFLAAASEYDDRPGPVRDAVLDQVTRWRGELRRALKMAIKCGHLKPGIDIEQLVFEIYGLALAVHHDAGFWGRDISEPRGMKAIDRIIQPSLT